MFVSGVSSCRFNSQRCSVRIRPINLIVVDSLPRVVSNLQRHGRAVVQCAGRWEFLDTTWDRGGKFALIREIARIRAGIGCSLNKTASRLLRGWRCRLNKDLVVAIGCAQQV